MVPAPRPAAVSRPSGAHPRSAAPRRSAQPAIHPARPRPGPRHRVPPQRQCQTRVSRRVRTPRRTRAARHSHARQPVAERPCRALAHPRARRILVFHADAEASPPAPGPDPGALRPRGRPRLPAHPFRAGRSPGRGRRRAGSFSLAALSPALDRRRYRVGAAPGPAAALAPDRLALGRTAGACTPGPAAPGTRPTATGAHAVAGAGVTVARADARPGTRANVRPGVLAGRLRPGRLGRPYAGPARRAGVFRTRRRRGRRPRRG
jgi:hypothetical protein